MIVFPEVIGNEFRMRNPPAASRDIVAADAPALSELYEDPASKSGENLLFYTRSTPSFAGVREFWNQHNDNVELLAVLCPRSESAVQAAVRFLTQRNIPLSVRSGGRGAYHQGRADSGGVVIDMRAMDGVSYNAPISSDIPYAVATVGGGITVGPLGRSLHSRNLITPTGWSSEIGFAGWLSGGGYGFLSTRWGLGVDNLVGARLVTSSGEIIDTDDEPNTDLLWALRGAGNGTLGVLTELRVKAFLALRFLCGVIAFPLSTAADVIRNFREILKAEDLPDAVAGESIVMYPPGLQPLFAFLFVWAIDQLGPLSKRKNVPLHEFHEWIATTAPAGNRYHMRTRNTRSAYLNEATAEILVRNPPPNHLSVVVIHNARGKAVDFHPGASFPVREEHTTYCIVGAAPAEADEKEMQQAVDWADRVWNELEETGLVMDQVYGNFENPTHLDVGECYGAESASRLRGIKKHFDPSNVFYKGYPNLG
ncbi:6-hydroxy-d-nicotine oxidase [Penicillium brevicompactum]|uniref:6-hydroxy-d-nicotine oxidase n=1 Tax=Penicillium brevicompactum TaxID=5074 RepID=A0A9W9Q7N2_PENBR|nr:6-hydroxy-d-nicotine oxidase [Penicillium brevicompactum]